jgi:hypothetical protein
VISIDIRLDAWFAIENHVREAMPNIEKSANQWAWNL